MCQHDNIIDRMCNDCGQVIIPMEMSRGWNSQNVVTKKPIMTDSFTNLISCGISLDVAKSATQTMSRVCELKKSTLKGNRKKGLLFACIFDQLRCDPDTLRSTMKLSRRDCIRGLELFEQEVKILNWDWKMLLMEKLRKLNLICIREEVEMQLLNSKLKMRQYIQIASCIAYICDMRKIIFNRDILMKEFHCKKLIAWKYKFPTRESHTYSKCKL